MDAQVLIDGQDVTSDVLRISRSSNYCSFSQTFELTLVLSNSWTINPYDEVEIYEEGTKVLTGFVSQAVKSAPEGTITVSGEDTFKRASDYFIETTYTTAVNQTVRYWIDFFLDLCGLTAIYTDGNGPYVVKDQEVGLDTVSNIITYLVQYAGWYGRINTDGVLVLGKISKDDVEFTIDDTILSVEYEKSYDKVRNVALIFGGMEAQEDQFEPVFAKSRTDLPFLPVDQTVVVGNHLIGDQETAKSFANDLVYTLSKPQFVKKLEIIGNPELRSGIYVEVVSRLFIGTALLSGLSSDFSEDGYKMSITLDDVCPRFSNVSKEQEILYAGTAGSGVWKHNIYSTTWTNLSSGLDQLYINDLSVDDGLFIAATPSGIYTKVNREPWFYEELPAILGSGNSVPSGTYLYPAVYASSLDESVYALVTLSGISNYTYLYQGLWEGDGFSWTGNPIVISGDAQFLGRHYFGLDMEGYEFDKYITVTRKRYIGGTLVFGYEQDGPFTGPRKLIFYPDDPEEQILRFFEDTFDNFYYMAVSPDGEKIAFIAKKPTDSHFELYITRNLTDLISVHNLDYNVVAAFGWHPNSDDFIFAAEEASSGQYVFYMSKVSSTAGVDKLSGITIPTDHVPYKDIAIHPDGDGLFAYTEADMGSSDLFVKTADYITETNIATIDTSTNDFSDFSYIKWLPDGSRVIYLKSTDTLNDQYYYITMEADGSPFSIITDTNADRGNFRFIDDSHFIYRYVELQGLTYYFYDAVANYIEEQTMSLSSSSQHSTIRYDGQRVAFWRADSVSPFPTYIRTNNLGATDLQTVLSLGNNIGVNDIKYSLTDNRLLFIKEDTGNIYTINDDGTNLQEVLTEADFINEFSSHYPDGVPTTSDFQFMTAQWVPNSNKILVEMISSRGTTTDPVFTYDLVTQEFVMVWPNDGRDLYFEPYSAFINLTTPAISPDGQYVLLRESYNVGGLMYTNNISRWPLIPDGTHEVYLEETVSLSNMASYSAVYSNDGTMIAYFDGTNIRLTRDNFQTSSFVTGPFASNSAPTLRFTCDDTYIVYVAGFGTGVVRIDGVDQKTIQSSSSGNTAITANPVIPMHVVVDAQQSNRFVASVFFRMKRELALPDLIDFDYWSVAPVEEPYLLHTITGSGYYDVLHIGQRNEFREVNVDTYLPMSVYGASGVWYAANDGLDFTLRIVSNKNVHDMAVKTIASGTKLMFATTNDGIYRAISSGFPVTINNVSATEIVARTYGSGELFFSVADEVKRSFNNGLTYDDITYNLPDNYDITVLRLDR
jgi:hypothetical protein